jgi:hypothetical protein
VECVCEGLQLILPCPSLVDGSKWRVDSVIADIFNYHGRHRVEMKAAPPSNNAPGWSNKGQEMFEGKYGFGMIRLGPFKLTIVMVLLRAPQQPNAIASPISSLIPETFNTPELSDVKLFCEGETFHCHKFVLSRKSDVFNFSVFKSFCPSYSREPSL